MLLEGGSEGPIASWVGNIDLLYRDPETGAVVVADFKTEWLGDSDPEKAARQHVDQGRVYVRAVQAALSLELMPLFEVWFIEGNQRIAVDLT